LAEAIPGRFRVVFANRCQLEGISLLTAWAWCVAELRAQFGAVLLGGKSRITGFQVWG
jgi:hypothetical protein